MRGVTAVRPDQASRHGSGSAGPSADGPLGGHRALARSGALFTAVVRRFFRDLHVVNVALTDARGRDLDEFGLLLHGFDAVAAAVVHAGAQATGHLEDDADDRTLVGHLPFDAFGHQLGGAGIAAAAAAGVVADFLEIAVRAALLHRTH